MKYLGERFSMQADKTNRPQGHQHRGRFTEGLLDNKAITKALDIKPGQTILDAGCGNGYMSKIFANAVSHSGKVYALDPDKYFINVLRHETRDSIIETVEGDITTPTGLNEASLDILYLATVIHGFSQQQIKGFIREAKRLLKTDGLLAIVEIEKRETPFGPPLKLRYSPEDLKKIIPMSPVRTTKAGEYFYIQIFKKIPESH